MRAGRGLAFVLPAVILAGCGGAPPERPAEKPGTGLARGIDLPIDSRDVSQELKHSGLRFVARYYRDPASRWPALSAEEARSVAETGIKLVAVYQYRSHRPDYFSHAAGYSDAMTAYRQAKATGQPPGSAIYFTVDYNAPDHEIGGPIAQYFRGIAAGLAAAGGAREYRVGVYGSGVVCDYLKRAGLAELAWLSGSTAWAGYGSFPDWDIRQGRRSPTLSFNNTENEARGDYGAFTVASR